MFCHRKFYSAAEPVLVELGADPFFRFAERKLESVFAFFIIIASLFSSPAEKLDWKHQDGL